MPELVTAAVAGFLVFRLVRFIGLRVVAGLEVINRREAAAADLEARLENVPDTYSQAGDPV